MVSKCFDRLRHLSQAGVCPSILVLLEPPMWLSTSSRLVNSEVNKHVFRPFHGPSPGSSGRTELETPKQAAAAANLQQSEAGAWWSRLEIQQHPHGARSRDDVFEFRARKRCGARTRSCGAQTRRCGAWARRCGAESCKTSMRCLRQAFGKKAARKFEMRLGLVLASLKKTTSRLGLHQIFPMFLPCFAPP